MASYHFDYSYHDRVQRRMMDGVANATNTPSKPTRQNRAEMITKGVNPVSDPSRALISNILTMIAGILIGLVLGGMYTFDYCKENNCQIHNATESGEQR